jgi:hypothetical protein
MSKARTLANLISDNAELADGQISVAEVVGAAPLANPTFTGNIDAGDNVKIRLGDSDDLQIYSNNNNSFITESGSGSLFVNASNLVLRNTSGEYYFYGNSDGAVNLYHNNEPKLATTSTGIDVTGDLSLNDGTPAILLKVSGAEKGYIRSNSDVTEVNGASGSALRQNGFMKLATTSTGIDVTGSVTADGGDFTGQVQFNGTAGIQLDNGAQAHTWTLDDHFTSRLNIGTSSGSATWKIGSNNNAYLSVNPTGVSVTGSVAVSDGIVDTGQAGSATVFNQSGSTADFRVESSGSEHMLFVDGGNNAVAIGTNSTTHGDLTVFDTGTTGGQLYLSDTTLGVNYGGFIRGKGVTGSGGYLYMGTVDANTQVVGYSMAPFAQGHTFSTRSGALGDTAARVNINTTGLIINDPGHDYDFRVASDNNDNMLFVDAGNNRIGINDSSPAHKLSIVGGGGTSSAIEICGTTNDSSQNDNATISSPFSMNFQVNNQTSGNQSGRAFVFRSGGAGYSDGTALFSIAEGVTSAQGNRIVSSEFSFNGGGTQTVLTPARGESWLLFAALQNYGTGDTRHGGLAIVSRTSQGNDETLLSTIIELDSTGLFAVSGSNVTYNGSGGNPYTAISMLRLT